jgi:hypothetical protein
MSSYLRSWFSLHSAELKSPTVPIILEVSPPTSNNDGEGEDTAGEDDTPPAFPAIGSAQRASSSNDVPRILTDSELMLPPPLPSLASRQPGVSSLTVPSSQSSSLAVPPTTTKRPTKNKGKVALAPGHSPLDWANLKSSGADLRVGFTESFDLITGLKSAY